MANTKSAKKANRSSVKKNTVNTARKNRIRSFAKKVDLAIKDGDEAKAREGARSHLKYLMKKYKGDVAKAIAAYNYGEKGIDASGLDNLPDETRDYMSKILSHIIGNDD